MNTETTPRPGRPRSEAVDRAILDAALALLVDGGLDALGYEQVARRAGVTRATVYRRYPTRNDLLIAAMLASHRDHTPASMPDEPTMEHLIQSWAEVISEPTGRKLLRRFMTVLHDHPELYAQWRRVSLDAREQAIDALLRRAVDRGELAPDADLETIRILISGAVAVHLTQYPDDTPAEEIADYLRKAVTALGYRKADR